MKNKKSNNNPKAGPGFLDFLEDADFKPLPHQIKPLTTEEIQEMMTSFWYGHPLLEILSNNGYDLHNKGQMSIRCDGDYKKILYLPKPERDHLLNLSKDGSVIKIELAIQLLNDKFNIKLDPNASDPKCNITVHYGTGMHELIDEALKKKYNDDK